MCYWYAGSTFEILTELCNGVENHDPICGGDRGKYHNLIAYRGVTQRGLKDCVPAKAKKTDLPLSLEDKIITIEDHAASCSGFVKQEGWDLTKLRALLGECPNYHDLKALSIQREKEVRQQLKNVCISTNVMTPSWSLFSHTELHN